MEGRRVPGPSDDVRGSRRSWPKFGGLLQVTEGSEEGIRAESREVGGTPASSPARQSLSLLQTIPTTAYPPPCTFPPPRTPLQGSSSQFTRCSETSKKRVERSSSCGGPSGLQPSTYLPETPAFHLPSNLSLLCFGSHPAQQPLIIVGAGRLGPGLWPKMTSYPLPPVGHVLLLSEANSDAKEDSGIGWSEPGQKGYIYRNVQGGGGGEAKSGLHRPAETWGKKGKAVLGHAWALTVDFPCTINLGPWKIEY